MHTTNYRDTFIGVAPDTRAAAASEPAPRDPPTIAQLHYELIAEHPYAYTSDDVVFETFARRAGIAADEREAARADFFSQGRPCLRSSPLGKTLGWGTHHDAEGRVALVPVESEEYARLSADPGLTQTRAMRTSRAR